MSYPLPHSLSSNFEAPPQSRKCLYPLLDRSRCRPPLRLGSFLWNFIRFELNWVKIAFARRLANSSGLSNLNCFLTIFSSYWVRQTERPTNRQTDWQVETNGIRKCFRTSFTALFLHLPPINQVRIFGSSICRIRCWEAACSKFKTDIRKKSASGICLRLLVRKESTRLFGLNFGNLLIGWHWQIESWQICKLTYWKLINGQINKLTIWQCS